MHTFPLSQIDAFTKTIFKGNPAGVCLLSESIPDEVMLSIAAEMNLAETAFLLPKAQDHWHLRWFTPTVEVPLCGHATLAAAHFLFEKGLWEGFSKLSFETLSGNLFVEKTGTLYTMDFPVYHFSDVEAHVKDEVSAYYPEVIACKMAEGNMILELSEEAQIFDFEAKMEVLKKWGKIGVIITSRSEKYDIISRYFAPNVGVPEDPVTGSAHVALCSYWWKKINKSQIRAYQASQRGGELQLVLVDQRVKIMGEAVSVFHTSITIA